RARGAGVAGAGPVGDRPYRHRTHPGRRVPNPDRPDGEGSMSATTTTTPTARLDAAPPRYSFRRALRVYRTEAWQEFLKLVRIPIFAASTIALPLMFYVIFGIAFAGERAGG